MSGFLPPILLIEGTCLNFAVSFVIVLAVFFVSLIMHAYRANIIYYYIRFSEAFFDPREILSKPASRKIYTRLAENFPYFNDEGVHHSGARCTPVIFQIMPPWA